MTIAGEAATLRHPMTACILRLVLLWISLNLGVVPACAAKENSPRQPHGKKTMKTLEFPQGITTKSISDKEATERYQQPEKLKFEGPQEIKRKRETFLLEAFLINESEEIQKVIVMPFGGSFPYGGESPFYVRFSPSAGKKIRSKETYPPPEPPLPMEIRIPAKSRIRFPGEVHLKHYTYEGSPTVEIEWGFYFSQEPFPKGKFEVTLPKR